MSASITPIKEKASAYLGSCGASLRNHQLGANRSNRTRLPPRCHKPTRLARVLAGSPSQSLKPKTAAASFPMIPAATGQKAITNQKQ